MIDASHIMQHGDCIRCGAGDWNSAGQLLLSHPCTVTDAEELAYLRYYHGEAQSAFGPASGDVDDIIAQGYEGVVPRGYDPRRFEEEDED
jgi:hypothetical protein